jgi:hypothetical protein
MQCSKYKGFAAHKPCNGKNAPRKQDQKRIQAVCSFLVTFCVPETLTWCVHASSASFGTTASKSAMKTHKRHIFAALLCLVICYSSIAVEASESSTDSKPHAGVQQQASTPSQAGTIYDLICRTQFLSVTAARLSRVRLGQQQNAGSSS